MAYQPNTNSQAAGRPAGPTGGALHVSPFSGWGDGFFHARKPHVDLPAHGSLGAVQTHGSGLLDRSVFIASTEREGALPWASLNARTPVGRVVTTLPFPYGRKTPGRPTRPAATMAYDGDNVGIDRPLSGPKRRVNQS